VCTFLNVRVVAQSERIITLHTDSVVRRYPHRAISDTPSWSRSGISDCSSTAQSGIVAIVPEHTPLVACFGEGLIALVPAVATPLENSRTFHRSLAGAEWNVAIALSAAGVPAAVISRVGEDGFGRFLLSELAAHGVQIDGVESDAQASTGLYVKELVPDAVGSYASSMHYYRASSAGSRISPETLHTPAAERILHEAQLVHTTGITPALSEGARAAQNELFDNREHRLISFDLNWRPALWAGREAEARVVLGDYMARADIAQCSEVDAQALFGTADAAALREMFGKPRYLIVTREDGSVAFDGAERVDAPALETPVVETIGAGDAFAAGFIAGVLGGLSLSGSVARAHRMATRVLGSTRDHVD